MQDARVPELVNVTKGRWRVGDTEFVYSYARPSRLGLFALRKDADLVAKYPGLCRKYAGGNIVELGIALGGSTALLAALAQPQKLVACELDTERIAELDELRAAKGLEATLRLYYGVDQSDRARLTEIMSHEFGASPLDLVIDDASHQYAETVASFEVLFPRLRAGGLFIIEDWAADYTRWKFALAALEDTASPQFAENQRIFASAMGQRARGERPVPLHRIGPELMELARQHPAVESIEVDRDWIAIERGDSELDPASFRLADARTGDWVWELP